MNALSYVATNCWNDETDSCLNFKGAFFCGCLCGCTSSLFKIFYINCCKINLDGLRNILRCCLGGEQGGAGAFILELNDGEIKKERLQD